MSRIMRILFHPHPSPRTMTAMQQLQRIHEQPQIKLQWEHDLMMGRMMISPRRPWMLCHRCVLPWVVACLRPPSRTRVVNQPWAYSTAKSHKHSTTFNRGCNKHLHRAHRSLHPAHRHNVAVVTVHPAPAAVAVPLPAAPSSPLSFVAAQISVNDSAALLSNLIPSSTPFHPLPSPAPVALAVARNAHAPCQAALHSPHAMDSAYDMCGSCQWRSSSR